MKRLLAVACALLLLPASFAFSQASTAASGGNADANLPKFTPAQLLEDFQIARRSLEEGHSGIYRYTPKARLDQIFDQAARSLNHPMDAYEFFRVLSPAVNQIKCGHTSVILPEALRAELNTRAPLLPLRVRVIAKKPYVFRDYSNAGQLAGMEIRSINGVAARRIVETMMAAASGDGDVETSRQTRIGDLRFSNLLISMLALIVVGLFRFATTHEVMQTPATIHFDESVGAISHNALTSAGLLWLLMRSFAAGCTALTGVEAISNGIPAFKSPESKNAATTLSVMALIMAVLILGSGFLAYVLNAHPSPNETLVSAIARHTFGGSIFYYVLQASTAAILILAANTSFADFPRLASLLSLCEPFSVTSQPKARDWTI